MEQENNMNDQETQNQNSGDDKHKLPKNIIILGGLVVIAVVVALVMTMGGKDSSTTEEDGNQEDNNVEEQESATEGTSSVIVVDVTDGGYPLEDINAVVGNTIRINNSSSGDIHPAARNSEYEGFDSIEPIQSGLAWEFTFAEEGEFEMYDKLDESVSVQIYVDV